MTDYLNYWSKDAAEAPHVPETWETDGPTKKEIDRDLYKRKAQGKKKDRSKDKKKPKKYKPQAGLEFDDDISVLSEEQAFVDMPEILAFEKSHELSAFQERLQLYSSHVMSHEIMKHIERLITLAVSLRGQKTTAGVLATLTLYTQTYFDGSYVVFVREFLQEFLSMEEQADFSWVEVLQGAYTNWRMVLESSSFRKVSAIMSVCTALGLVQHSRVNLTKDGIKQMTKSNFPIHMGAIDMVDAILGSVTHFVERGFMFFKTRDWRVLFLDNKQALDFDTEYLLLLKMHDYALTGDVEPKFNVSDDEYADRLIALLEKAKEAYQKMPNGFEKKVYYERFSRLQKMEVEFEMRRSHGGLREAPLGICVYGPSSVGKSTVVNIVNTALMKCFDLGGQEHVVTLNEIDKFESNMRSNIRSVILDDVANTKPEFIQNSPSERIIRYVNNIIQTANMAEADMKGKIQIRPKVVFATSNVKDLGASMFSNEPVSVIRRMSLIITVKVREEYRLHGKGQVSQMLDTAKIPKNDQLVQDLWQFDVERCVGIPDGKAGSRKPDHITYVPYEFEGKETRDLDIFTLIRFVNTIFAEHQANQKKLVKTSNSLFDTLDVCKVCYNLQKDCKCMDKQALSDVIPACVERGCQIYDRGLRYFYWSQLRSFQAWQYFGLFRQRHHLMTTLRAPCISMLIMTSITLIGTLSEWSLFLWCCWLYFAFAFYDRVCIEFEQAVSVASRLPNLYNVFRNVELDRTRKLVLGSAFIGILYTVCSVWRAARRFDKQGNLQPTSHEEVNERDFEESDWAQVRIEPLPVSHQSNTITEEQLQGLVESNLCHVVTEGGSEMNAFFVKSNLALIPGHMLDGIPGKKVKQELIGTFTRYGDEYTRGAWKARLSRTYSYSIPGVDVRVVWVPNSPSFKDLSSYLPEGIVRAMPGMLMRKMEDGDVKKSSVRLCPNGSCYDYKLDYPTYFGLCGAPLLGFSKANMILGIHTAGRTGLPDGRASCVTRQAFRTAEEFFMELPGYCPAAAAGEMKTSLYDKQFFVAPQVHEKSPVNFLEQGSTVQVYGSCIGRSTAKSSVQPTIISECVAKHTGVKQQYGPPKFRGPNGKQPWHPWRESLNKSGQTTIGVEGRILARAVEDYQEPLIRLLHEQSWWKDEIKPLSRLQNISGIDGRKFVNAIAPYTSVGYPLNGPKSEYMFDLDVLDHPSHNCPRDIDEMFWKESVDMERKYMQGVRTYPVFKGCLKDEPTKSTKDKVRVFQASPIALQLLIRKYYLPIARFMSMNPLVTECAVGINAIGPEWDQLTRHITKFGKNNILAGDYSKYDLTMSPQLMFAAFSVMVRLAKEAGYPKVCLDIMQMLATDICYPVVAYNGDLVELLGSNPSGQNLTVYINSIVNSLLFRSGYFTLIGLDAPLFRSKIALITYGDDAKSSVSDDVKDKIDHIKFAKFLDSIGMKFTMPDKDSEATPFMSDEDADLLKRKNVWMEELGHWVGALDEDSIFKALHCVLKSKVLSPKEQAVQNIDTAIQDWFYHGRETYGKRLNQMRLVAKEMKLDLLCNNLDCSFEHWVARWRNKYLGEENPMPEPDLSWRL
jgi:transposase